MANERLPERAIPDRRPGHAFVPITGPAGVTGAVRFPDNGTDKAGPPKPEHLQ